MLFVPSLPRFMGALNGAAGMRVRAKVDRNQPEIVAALRKAGAVVHCTHQLGKGFPDLFCNYRGRIFGFEVKDPMQNPAARKPTPDQVAWLENWNRCGETVFVIETAEAAILIMQERTK